MNILIIDDTNLILEQILNTKETVFKDYEIYDYFNYNSMDFYKSQLFDFIVADTTSLIVLDILSEILKINPLQKTIAYNDYITPNELKGCSHCLKNFNKKRLINFLKVLIWQKCF